MILLSPPFENGEIHEADKENYAYDPSGRLAGTQNAHSRHQYFYDKLSNLIREYARLASLLRRIGQPYRNHPSRRAAYRLSLLWQRPPARYHSQP
ncbi:MAG: hypothetical protein HXM87_10250 [Neisseria sp.]|uniref:hypothetical protein n=1 Tax=Neisseria sp. TaxID=192066 RepID=UPI001CB5C5BC|nr:hypothetical protein [Neisseria sp.]